MATVDTATGGSLAVAAACVGGSKPVGVIVVETEAPSLPGRWATSAVVVVEVVEEGNVVVFGLVVGVVVMMSLAAAVAVPSRMPNPRSLPTAATALSLVLLCFTS